MNSRATVMVGVSVFVVVALTAVAWAQFGPGGPPPGGRGGPPPGGPPPGSSGSSKDMQAMVYLEKTWTAVTFQLGCTDEQLATLKTTYTTELQTRNDALAKAMAERNKKGVKAALETCRTNLDAKLKEVLTDEQRMKLECVLKPPGPPARD